MMGYLGDLRDDPEHEVPVKRKRGRPLGSTGKKKRQMTEGTPGSPVLMNAQQKRGRPRKSMTPSSAIRGGPTQTQQSPAVGRVSSPVRHSSPLRAPPTAMTPTMQNPDEPTAPRGRGRPRKHPLVAPRFAPPHGSKSTEVQTPPMPPMPRQPVAEKRGRGRPRKSIAEENTVRRVPAVNAAPARVTKAPAVARVTSAPAVARVTSPPAAGGKRPVGHPRKHPVKHPVKTSTHKSPTRRVPAAATHFTAHVTHDMMGHGAPPNPPKQKKNNNANKVRVVKLIHPKLKRQKIAPGSLIQALTASDSDNSREFSSSDSEDERDAFRMQTSPTRRIVRGDASNAAGPSNAAPSPTSVRPPPNAPHSSRQHHLNYQMDDYMGADVVRDEPQMDAVVKVFCTHTEPNYSLPWQKKRQTPSTSSGFIIEGNRVLTNAHSVEHHTQVKLKKRGEDKKYVARVLAIGVECDLALLTVDDESFFAGVEPVVIGHLPGLQDSVTVVGYPIGGVAISVTQGVVSRIEVTAYSHGSSELLGLQIDAAINSGNSGGPAFNAEGECVGVAFQSLKHDDAENIGYVIPSPVIMHFLQDYFRNGRYTGFPTLGLEWQKLENPDMRKYLRMRSLNENTSHGVYVRRVSPMAAAGKLIQSTDVLLSFDGVPIANDGTVPFRTGERISFHYLVSEKYVGERAEVSFLRDGKVHNISLQMNSVPRLVPIHIHGKPPTYFIVAGLVFTTVCVPYLKSEYGKDYDYDAPVKLLDSMMHEHVNFPGQNVVVLAQVLASDVNIGYEDIVNTVVKGFNGVAVNDLKQLAWMVETCGEEFLRFQLEHDLLVVLKRTLAQKETKNILKTHCIPNAKSEDLR